MLGTTCAGARCYDQRNGVNVCRMAVVPYFPNVLETEFVGVDADESPYGEDQDPEHVEAEHLWGHQLDVRRAG